MAADLSQDVVLHFIQSHGGSVKNAELLLHFRAFLQDHVDRDRNREQFKKLVNSVATVKQEHGVSHVILRRRFRGPVPGPGGLQAPRSAPTSEDKGSRRPAWSTEKSRAGASQWRQETEPGLEKLVLPAAGIILNNNNNLEHYGVHVELEPRPKVNLEHHRVNIENRPEPGPKVSLEHHRVHIEPGPRPQVVRETNLNLGHHRAHTRPEPGPNVGLEHHKVHIEPGLGPKVCRETNLDLEHHTGPEVYTKTSHGAQSRPGPGPLLVQQQLPECIKERGCGLQLEEEPPLPHVVSRCHRHRKSYKSAISVDDDDDGEEEEFPRRSGSVGGTWPLSSPLLHTARVFSSSPCIMEPPSPSSPSFSSHRQLPQIFVQDVEEGRGLTQYPHHSLPLETELCGAAQTLSSCGSDFSVSGSDQHLPESSGWAWSSCDDLQTRTGETGSGATHTGGVGPLLAVKTLSRRSANLYDNHDMATCQVAFHHSTGDLYDKEVGSSDDSTSPLEARQRPVAARRLSSKLRSRMCRSLGTDLDQLLQEEDTQRGGGAGGSEAARLNRLHLISSSLNLTHNLSSSSLSSCSTPPRCLSFLDLVEGTAGPLDGSGRSSQFSMESGEHMWLVKAAAGVWPDIYSLFRKDSSLLNKRDFISGFTVLHWIAKHGDHRVLNTLWYGAEKAGLTFDINAQSSCGYTPLHIAAIHNHKNIMRLLVNKFSADLRRRDVSGKRAWQYLGHTAAPELFQLLGAPPRAGQGLQGEGQCWEPQRRHRRRHHFSSAGEKPLNLTKVKRSSSIAAFLKRKSKQRLMARPQSEALL